MASLTRALNYELKNTSGVSDLVGARIFVDGDISSSVTTPFLTHSLISRVRDRHQAGGPNLTTDRIQINALGLKADSSPELTAAAVADAVTAALDRFRGAMGEAGATVTVRGAYLESRRDVPIEPSDGSQRGPHEVQMDFLVSYVEA